MNKLEHDQHKEFFRSMFSLLDAYLILDLETLINEIPARPSGGVGYPALHTILSGMELLGLLLCGEKSDAAFKNYWAEYLSKNSNYQSELLRRIFREVIRNGTAHLFLVKKGVSVSKDGQNHLKQILLNGTQLLNIDLKILHGDFIDSYEAVKKDILSGEITPKLIKGHVAFETQMHEANNLVSEYFREILPTASHTSQFSATVTSASVSFTQTVQVDNNDFISFK